MGQRGGRDGTVPKRAWGTGIREKAARGRGHQSAKVWLATVGRGPGRQAAQEREGQRCHPSQEPPDILEDGPWRGRGIMGREAAGDPL